MYYGSGTIPTKNYPLTQLAVAAANR